MRESQQSADAVIDQQHKAIIVMCERLASALVKPEQMVEITASRMQLASLLHANLVLEEAAIFGPLRSRPKVDRPSSFDHIEAEAADLRPRYSEHVRKWNGVAIQDAPSRYAIAAGLLIRDMRSHLQFKQSVLPSWRADIADWAKQRERPSRSPSAQV
jgi:hypothetical protein